ncbi:uncharacterized protein ACB057_013960 [Neosynchiropus ocellatus]
MPGLGSRKKDSASRFFEDLPQLSNEMQLSIMNKVKNGELTIEDALNQARKDREQLVQQKSVAEEEPPPVQYNFSVHKHGRYRWQKRVLQIDFKTKLLCSIEKGIVKRQLPFSIVKSCDDGGGSRFSISFKGHHDYELEATSLEEKHKMMQLVNQIIYGNIYSDSAGGNTESPTQPEVSRSLKEGVLLLHRGGLASFRWVKYEVQLHPGQLTLVPLKRRLPPDGEATSPSAVSVVIHLSDGDTKVQTPYSLDSFTLVTHKNEYHFKVPVSAPNADEGSVQEQRDAWVRAIDKLCCDWKRKSLGEQKLLQMISKSFWKQSSRKKIEVDTSLLLEQFAVKEMTSFDMAESKNTQNIMLNDKIAHNFNIFLKSFPVQPGELKDKLFVVNEEDGGLSDEHITSLRRYVPTLEDVEMYKSYKGAVSELHIVDRYMMEMCHIPHLSAQLDLLLTLRELPVGMRDLQPLMNQKIRMCSQLLNSGSFVAVLEYLLAIGNCLNENAGKGKARGFRLSSLTKLSQLRGREKKFTLLHALVEQIMLHEPGLASFTHELAEFETVPGASIKGLTAEVDVLKNELQKVHQYKKTARKWNAGAAHANFLKELKVVIDNYDTDLAALTKTCEEMKKLYSAVLKQDTGEGLLSSSEIFVSLLQLSSVAAPEEHQREELLFTSEGRVARETDDRSSAHVWTSERDVCEEALGQTWRESCDSWNWDGSGVFESTAQRFVGCFRVSQRSETFPIMGVHLRFGESAEQESQGLFMCVCDFVQDFRRVRGQVWCPNATDGTTMNGSMN